MNRAFRIGCVASDARLLVKYVLIATLISLLVISLAGLALWQEKQRYRERASVATQNIARLLDQQLAAVFDKIDVMLHTSQLLYADMAKSGRIEPDKLNRHLAQQESLLPEVLSFRIADKDGIVRYGKAVSRDAPISLSDRAYFIQARALGDAGMVVQGPILARISNKWVIVLARRLNAPDGSFAGVVYANLACDYFEKVLSLASLGPRGAATIRGSDLALVSRVPDTKNAAGSKEVSRQLSEAILTRPDGGEYIAVTKLDGIERSNAYRRLKDYPFYVIVGLATADYLGGWKEYALGVEGLTGLTLLIIWLAMAWVFRTQRDLNEDIVKRTQISKELEQALAELEVRRKALEEVNQTLELKVSERTAELCKANFELARLARRDALTRLGNRLAADEHLHEEFLRMKRTGGCYSLLLVDIDNFKQVNDNHGHELGDTVLKHIARVLNDSCRATDFVARFGGEEFLVILPNTAADHAWLVAEKMREAAASTEVAPVGVVTVSIGVACAARADADEIVALRRADINLYKAKANGRNQVADDESGGVVSLENARHYVA